MVRDHPRQERTRDKGSHYAWLRPSVDVREYVDSESYTGPTKKGVRFAWDKLTEFIGLLETQARQLGLGEKAQPTLIVDAHPSWVKQAESAGADKGPGGD